MPASPTLRQYLEKETSHRTNKILGAVKNAAKTAGVPGRTVAVTSDSPYEMIIKQAKKARCDLIIMATHGRSGLKGILLGRQTQKVLAHSNIPVLVCR